MTVVTVFVVLAIAILATWSSQYGAFGVRRGPLWPAFSSTFVSILFLGAGVVGYNLNRHERFVTGTSWRGGVIWWQVWVGVGLLVFAAAMWRRGIRSIRQEVCPPTVGHSASRLRALVRWAFCQSRRVARRVGGSLGVGKHEAPRHLPHRSDTRTHRPRKEWGPGPPLFP